MSASPKSYARRDTFSGYLEDSGFSGAKKSVFVVGIVLGWVLGALVLVLWFVLVNELSGLTGTTFGDIVGLWFFGAFLASLLILPAVLMRHHVKKAALSNRGETELRESDLTFTKLPSWTCKDGTKLYFILQRNKKERLIFAFDEPIDELNSSTVSRSNHLVGYVHWNSATYSIVNVSVSDSIDGGKNWRRLGIGTHLYEQANRLSPGITYGQDCELSPEEQEWIKTLNAA